MGSVQKLCMIVFIFATISFIAFVTLKFQRIPFTDQEFIERIKIKLIQPYDPQTKLINDLNITFTTPNIIQNSTEISSIQEDIFSFKTELPKNSMNLSNEISVLTAYFNLGAFAKGSPGHKYTPNGYYKWMSIFGSMTNNLIVYTDDKTAYEYFQKLREKFPKERTKLFLIDKKELWSFNIEKNISDIFKQPGYPRFLPNTVVPGYSCAMHAKFEVLNRVIRKNYFHTKYFMWLDIGLFRSLTRTPKFELRVPTNFDDTKVAYSFVFDFKKDVTYKDIIYHNMVWVGGASNLGKYDVLYKFTQEYLNFVNKSLSIKLMSTDQQIIYGMYVDKHKPETKLQLYKTGWFKLGYLCYAAKNTPT
ncbi:uncharacterized protein LOC106877989 [Octopus bimaculoides]|uniref:Uncharacterized protein n=1 Tax=Octopus bimaculoides TaxID=37653 RepID=A0A0L8GB36_OCTBM|nr:uncharacterized protein LOC106877989 [Octopus bimaculoides]|eukprot:XP_014782549.1 PREDICTED: uncharacterized protein LOC106877989 [Octopus bimaculoides]